MKNYKQLEVLFGRELNSADLTILAKVFGRSIDSLFKDTEDISIQPLDNMPTESILSGKMMNSNEFEYHWQKLSNSRRMTLSEKLKDRNFAPGYEKQASKLSAVTDTISDAMGHEVINDLYDAINEQEYALTHLHYNKGYFDGIKFALMAGQL